MTDSLAIIRFDGNGRVYGAGDTLSGEYRFNGVLPAQIKAVEVSVLWYSEGKGDEDMAVHEFWRSGPDEGERIDPSRPAQFTTTLPNCPLSYEGLIVKIRWCVRVRAILHRGKDVVAQKSFRLGGVPAVEVSAS